MGKNLDIFYLLCLIGISIAVFINGLVASWHNEEVLVMLHWLFIGFLALTILYLGLKLKFNEKD